MKILSTSASMSRPKSVTASSFRAIQPSKMSVRAARMKKANAALAQTPAQ